MSGKLYDEEFRHVAVGPVPDRGYSVPEKATRLMTIRADQMTSQY